MSTLRHDFSFGFRLFKKHSGFAIAAVATLAIVMAANTAVFSLVSSVLMHRFGYPEVEQLVFLWEGEDGATVSPLNYLDWKEQATVFESMAAFDDTRYTLTGDGAPTRVPALRVAPDFFEVTQIRPAIGSAFGPRVQRGQSDRQAILGHALWQQYFSGRADIVGSSIRLDGNAYEVVGVLPADFKFPGHARYGVLTPLIFTPGELQPNNRGAHWIGVLARLGEDATIEQARTEMTTIAARLAEEYPDTNAAYGSAVISFQEQFVGQVRLAILLLFAAVGALLVIACVNLANLMLVRAAGRRTEFGIRAALGASRLQMSRQLLCESLTLGGLGGLLGLILAYWGVDLLVASAPSGIPLLESVAIDGRVVSFTLGVSVLAGVLFGLAPILSLSADAPAQAVGDIGRSMTAGRGQRRLARFLVVGEIALSLLLLIGAGLLMQTLINISRVEPGFSIDRAFTFRLSLPGSDYPPPEKPILFYSELEDRLAAVAGVGSVGATMTLPLSGSGGAYSSFSIEGREEAPDGEEQFVSLRPVTAGYFEAMGIPLLAGRGLSEADRQDSEGVVVINQKLARDIFGEENPLGRRIRPHVGMAVRGRWATIVGIVGDVKHSDLQAEPPPELYIPHPQQPMSSMSVVVRTELPPDQLMAQAREIVAEMDATLPVPAMQTLEDVYSESFAAARFRSLLVSVFATVAVVLAAIGLYGVMAYSVGRRRREFGIRMALGANRHQILTAVLMRGVVWTLAGLALGLALAVGFTRYMESLLFGVASIDLATFAALAALLLVVATIASYLPARRATLLDPIETLRYE